MISLYLVILPVSRYPTGISLAHTLEYTVVCARFSFGDGICCNTVNKYGYTLRVMATWRIPLAFQTAFNALDVLNEMIYVISQRIQFICI